MVSRRLVFVTSIVATGISSFTLGVLHSRKADAAAETSYHAQIEALRQEMRSQIGHAQKSDPVLPAGTIGQVSAKEAPPDAPPSMASRAKMVAEI